MKRFASLFVAAMLMCGILLVPVSAARIPDYVFSPGYEIEIIVPPNDPQIPPVEPGDPGDPEIPLDPPAVPEEPSSPQTGYGMGVVGLSAAAVLCGAVAVVSGKKAFGRKD